MTISKIPGVDLNPVTLISLILVLLLALILPRSMSFLPGVFGILVTAAVYIRHRTFIFPPQVPAIFFGIVVALACISLFWTNEPAFSLDRTIKVALVFVPGIFFVGVANNIEASENKKLVWALFAIYGLAAIILLSENSLHHPLYKALAGDDASSHLRTLMNRNAVAISLCYIPIAFLVRKTITNLMQKYFVLTCLTVIVAAALLVSNSQTAQLSFLVGFVFLYAFPTRFKSLWVGIGIVTIIGFLIFPWAVRPLYKQFSDPAAQNDILREASIPHRLEIWSFIADKTLEKPLLGHGIEATRFLKSDRWMKYPNSNEIMHPHNALLQIWVEFGLLGTALASAFFSWLLWRGWHKAPEERSVYLATLMACICTASTGYGLWQGWQLGMFFLLAGLVTMATKKAA